MEVALYNFQYDWFRADMMKATLAMLEMDRKAQAAQKGKNK